MARQYGKSDGLREIGKTKAQLMEGYQCTLVAPKSMVPIAFFRLGGTMYAFSPDLSRYIGRTYWGDDQYVDGEECTRQHMSPGLASFRDKGKGLGTTMYLGGCLSLHYNTCTYSIEGDRSAWADSAWESMRYHNLSTEEISSVNHYFREEFDGDDLVPDDDQLGEQILNNNDVYDAEINEVEYEGRISATVSAYGSSEVDLLKEDTILESSGLVLHVEDGRSFTPIPPDGLAVIDWEHTPYSLFQDILQQQYENSVWRTPSFEAGTEEYAKMVAEQLRKRKKRKLAEYALTTFNEMSRIPKLKGPAIRVRNNPSKVRKEFQKLDKEWMAAYSKGNWP